MSSSGKPLVAGGRLKLKGIGFLPPMRPAAVVAGATAAEAASTADASASVVNIGAKRVRPQSESCVVKESVAITGASQSSTAQAMTAATRTLGSGRIQVSGAIVTGLTGTRFRSELATGDALEVCGEVRVVKMVVSDTSAGLNAPFSPTLASTLAAAEGTEYYVLRLPRAIVSPEAAAAAASALRAAEEASAYGRYGAADGRTFVYREKKSQGTYAIKSVTLDTAHSREQMLDLRAKVKGDKHCR